MPPYPDYLFGAVCPARGIAIAFVSLAQPVQQLVVLVARGYPDGPADALRSSIQRNAVLALQICARFLEGNDIFYRIFRNGRRRTRRARRWH